MKAIEKIKSLFCTAISANHGDSQENKASSDSCVNLHGYAFHDFAVYEIKTVRYFGLGGFSLDYAMLPITFIKSDRHGYLYVPIKYPKNMRRIGGYELDGSYKLNGDL